MRRRTRCLAGAAARSRRRPPRVGSRHSAASGGGPDRPWPSRARWAITALCGNAASSRSVIQPGPHPTSKMPRPSWKPSRRRTAISRDQLSWACAARRCRSAWRCAEASRGSVISRGGASGRAEHTRSVTVPRRTDALHRPASGSPDGCSAAGRASSRPPLPPGCTSLHPSQRGRHHQNHALRAWLPPDESSSHGQNHVGHAGELPAEALRGMAVIGHQARGFYGPEPVAASSSSRGGLTGWLTPPSS